MRIELRELDEQTQRILGYESDRAFIECRPLEGEFGEQLNRIGIWRAHYNTSKLELIGEFLELDSQVPAAKARIASIVLENYRRKFSESDPLDILIPGLQGRSDSTSSS